MALKNIWTIGHSTRTLDEFLQLLFLFRIATLVDVRHYPGSRKFPQYNKDALHESLARVNIAYQHIESLGGRRKAHSDSKNIAWRHPAFRGYADYMETEAFQMGKTQLEKVALESRTAYMCSEAVWWRCHRALISDLFKSEGWLVLHIGTGTKAVEHPFTAPAKLVNGKLSYT
jgi:uncharacterized protein (DUF488 family)